METLLTIKDLRVTYETDEATVYAVNHLDLSVNKGETLGIVGETGAGKTTTALSIMRLLPDKIGKITGGQITLDGVDVIKASEADMRLLRGKTVSMIFQDPMTSLNPTIPIGQQIGEVLLLHSQNTNKQKLEARVDEILQLVGIPADRKREYPHQFYGGMKQRVVTAIALACEPKLLLADEPTTALDVTIQAQVLDMMSTLKQELNTAMILITHDLGIVAQICDNVAIMYAGEIIESGTVEDIFEGEKHHPYTDGLFGSIPSLTTSARRLNPIEGLMPDPTNLPSGCVFHARCPKRMEVCETQKADPVLYGTHMIKCHYTAGCGQTEEREGGK